MTGCCPVETIRTDAQSVLRSAIIKGAIFMASGRVPTTHMIFIRLDDCIAKEWSCDKKWQDRCPLIACLASFYFWAGHNLCSLGISLNGALRSTRYKAQGADQRFRQHRHSPHRTPAPFRLRRRAIGSMADSRARELDLNHRSTPQRMFCEDRSAHRACCMPGLRHGLRVRWPDTADSGAL